MNDRRVELARLQIEQDEREISATLHGLLDDVSRATDWRRWVRRWPAHSFVAALTIGYLVGRRRQR
jgi:hypothetical protein